MKICLIAGNDPQYVTCLPKELHRLNLRGIMRKYVGKLISCGVTEFYVSAESDVKAAAEEVLGGFNKKSLNAENGEEGEFSFSAVIAVWGHSDNRLCGAVKSASVQGLPFVVIDAETLSVTSFKI